MKIWIRNICNIHIHNQTRYQPWLHLPFSSCWACPEIRFRGRSISRPNGQLSVDHCLGAMSVKCCRVACANAPSSQIQFLPPNCAVTWHYTGDSPPVKTFFLCKKKFRFFLVYVDSRLKEYFQSYIYVLRISTVGLVLNGEIRGV